MRLERSKKERLMKIKILNLTHFTGMSMQIQTIRVKSPDSSWYTLTGGDGMPG